VTREVVGRADARLALVQGASVAGGASRESERVDIVGIDPDRVFEPEPLGLFLPTGERGDRPADRRRNLSEHRPHDLGVAACRQREITDPGEHEVVLVLFRKRDLRLPARRDIGQDTVDACHPTGDHPGLVPTLHEARRLVSLREVEIDDHRGGFVVLSGRGEALAHGGGHEELAPVGSARHEVLRVDAEEPVGARRDLKKSVAHEVGREEDIVEVREEATHLGGRRRELRLGDGPVAAVRELPLGHTQADIEELRVDRLRHVVVGAHIEHSAERERVGVAGDHQNDRLDGGVGGADPSAHLEPVHAVGQTEVEKNERELALLKGLPSGQSVGTGDHLVTAGPEDLGVEPALRGVVLHQEDR